jgi:transposase
MEDAISAPQPKNLLADAGYDSDANRQELLIHGIRPVIKPNPTRKNVPSFDTSCYKTRNQIERMFNKLKQMRRIATRYDKTKSSFQGFVALAAIRLWLPSFVHAT